MFARNKILHLKAGERKRIIHRFSNNIPVRFSLKFRPTGNTALQGTLEVHRSALLLDNKLENYPLEEQMVLETAYWDAFYSVFVTPEVDMSLELSSAGAKWLKWLTLIAVLVAVLASLIIFFSLPAMLRLES